ncbi:MAG: D-glycero-beta-D-manno-heptose 1-phosphate adenylyltransferase, partial [Bacteroidota bacterium]|nr:D-glycero-beta-D-manno-heptose 1-phosphate adenylyltransferase [Bacteroidota bacterium]
LCPEAPVPVVDIIEKTMVPGGAANTVCNLRSLGAKVAFCTVVGDDDDADDVIRMLRELNVTDNNIIRHPRRRTITKSRVVSGSQVITRIDQGSAEEIDPSTTGALMDRIAKEYETCDAVILSDYGKGLITGALVKELARLRANTKKFLAVDSRRLSFFAELNPSFAKPNYDEAVKTMDLKHSKERIKQIERCADGLVKKMNAPLIAVTLDSEGTLLIESGKPTVHIPAPYVERPHVSGAGDTYISAFVLAYLQTADAVLCAEIATAAAEIAIRKEGTTPCTIAELKSHFNLHSKYIAHVRDLRAICDAYRQTGKRIVFTNGCFDILHSGHVTYLHRARTKGDVLIVGLNTDESIRRIKGQNRPINTLSDRLQVLAGLSSVDHIIPFGSADDDTPIPLIRIARPNVFAKGGDYTKENLPEAETVEACGGEIVFIEQVPDHSTTRIINRITAVTKDDMHTNLSESEI